MISEHEFVLKIRDDLYPRIRQVEKDAVTFFNLCFPESEQRKGETGLTGDTEVEWSIQLLRSAARVLEEECRYDAGGCGSRRKPFYDDLYRRIHWIENEVLTLFNQNYAIGRGPTGLQGQTSVEWMIQLLLSAASMIERLGRDKNVLR